MKLSNTWGRVVRSPIPKRGEAFLMAGSQFEDGLYRVIVGLDVSPETVAEIEAHIADPERVQRIVEGLNALLRNHPNRSEA